MVALPIDPERVRELFTYDPLEGVLYWAKPACARIKPGAVAGGLKSDGDRKAYWVVRMDGRRYRRSRLVWAFVHGTNPEFEIDHIDRNYVNDRVENLRLATRTQNSINRVVPKTTYPNLPRGVRPKRKLGNVVGYRGRVVINGRRIDFGPFTSAEAAGRAVRAALVEAHGEAWLPTKTRPRLGTLS
ncbi:HNH endonuclease signature motif containing protein [Aureimonas altamirensis]|uniref:HNH endonuclease signature motif containing protein n=1 Tax=Aureimonas altamirensis TaxID=370622 RepID=UPI0009DEC78C|nr:HNH endonuclease signature motif containing protein [Aureimonas altamirensis]